MPLSSRPGRGKSRGTSHPHCKDNSVECFDEFFRTHVHANMHARLEGNAFNAHLFYAAVNEPLFHLEVWNSVPQKSARPVILFKYGYKVSCARKLLGARKTGRTGTNNSHSSAGQFGRSLGLYPSFCKTAVNDAALIVLNGNRRLNDPQHACAFAWSGAQASCELRKVVC